MKKYKVMFQQDVYGDITVSVEATRMDVAIRKASRILDNTAYACLKQVVCRDNEGRETKISIREFLDINNFQWVIYSIKGQNIYGGYKTERAAKADLAKLEKLYNLIGNCDIVVIESYRIVEQVSHRIHRLELV